MHKITFAVFLALTAGSFSCSYPKRPIPPLADPETMRGPKGGFMMEYTFMELAVEAVVTPDGLIRIYGYEKDGKQGDLIQYYPRLTTSVRLAYYPEGEVVVEFGLDRDRGCLMAKIDMYRARKILQAPNVVINLF